MSLCKQISVRFHASSEEFSKSMKVAQDGMSELAKAWKEFNLAYANRKNRKPRGMRKFT